MGIVDGIPGRVAVREGFDEEGFAGGELEINLGRSVVLTQSCDANSTATGIHLRDGLRRTCEFCPAVKGFTGQIAIFEGEEVEEDDGCGNLLREQLDS